jgi:large subunit ribosomal protein L10
VNTLAFTRKEKEAIVKQYKQWVDNSTAFFILSYQKMNMSAINEAREKLREVNAEIHVVKNRLFKLALDEKQLPYDPEFWEENNIVGFAFSDAPATAKVITEITKSNIFGIRMGYMDQRALTAENVKALADLPTLPVMRGILLGTIMASASKLVRTLAEPARSMAAVIKAFSEEGQAA